MKHHTTKVQRRRKAAAFTLVELLTATAVLAVVSVAVTSMLTGALHTQQYVINSGDSSSELEFAARRILHNVRAAGSLVSPTTGAAQSTLQIQTQPDPANSNQVYTVSYQLSNGNLQEVDPRFSPSTNTLATGITAFSVKLINTASPKMLQISITGNNKAGAMTRSFYVTCRNPA